MTPQGAVLMAHYNRWMNDRLYEAAGTLDADALTADRGAFFGSILGTLNHLAVADTIWLHRFAQHPASFPALDGLQARPTSLRQEMAPDLAGLRAYRAGLDERIERWAASLTAEHLSATLQYANMAGVVSGKRFGALVMHFFNHQTHHRGQASTLLFQAGVDLGVTDLLALIPSDTSTG
ncbi:MAG: DinB family protein [Rhizobacter sp.]|nr:DinB family protein [Rhizobacter sp.]